MAAISTWSTTAASNNSASPDGFPEGMAPSGVNDSARENMSALRTWYEDAEWINWGDTTAYVGATQFKIAGSDVTARYSVNRRVRVVGSSTGTIYGYISVSAFSTDTTVTVVFDSGSMSSETLTVSLGIVVPGRSGPGLAGTNTWIDQQTVTAKVVIKLDDSGSSTSNRMLDGQDSGGNGRWAIGRPNAGGIEIETFNGLDLELNPAGNLTTGGNAVIDASTAGRQVQVVNTQTGAVNTGTTIIPVDDTIPQNDEGDEYMTLAITPTSATNLLIIETVAFLAHSATGTKVTTALFQDSTAGALAAGVQRSDTADTMEDLSFTHKMTAGTTSSTTFKLRCGNNNAGTTTFNGESGSRIMGGVLASSITITEIQV